MTTKDEALRIALEALEKSKSALAEELAAWDIDPPLHHVNEAHDLCDAAITAIKQAQEPVNCALCGEDAPFQGTCGGGRSNPAALCYAAPMWDVERLESARQQANQSPTSLAAQAVYINGLEYELASLQAQQVQEPVAIPRWVEVQQRSELAQAIYAAIRKEIPDLGPWKFFDVDAAQRIVDAIPAPKQAEPEA